MISIIGYGQGNLIPPSPNSASIAQYSETPVNMYTGIPAINIPLGVASGNKIAAPINLSYLAVGRKVDEVAPWVGLGWTLNAGGVITRVVRGRPDEITDAFLDVGANVPNALSMTNTDSLYDMAANFMDMVPDLFYFNAGGASGKFVFGNDGQPLLVPRSEVRIEADIYGVGNTNSFTLTLADGTIYEFGGDGYTDETVANFPGSVATTYSSSWYLKNIISADRTDTISFSYYPSYSLTCPTQSGKTMKYYYNVPVDARFTEGSITESIYSRINEVNVLDLKTIEFTNGKIEFSRLFGRLDVSSSQLDYIRFYSKDPIDGSFSETNNYHFVYSYFQDALGNAKRLRLDEIQMTAGAISPPSYTFDYFDTILPDYGSFAQDHWGYYNQGDNNTSLIPEFSFNGTVMEPGNTRDPNYNGSLACMLQAIHYPKGGKVTYEYEANSYALNGLTYNAGGLRIKSITATDPFSQINDVTNFKYGDGTLVAGYQYYSDMLVKEKIAKDGSIATYNCELIMGNPIGLGSNSGGIVTYKNVTKYKGDGYSNFGKSVYTFSDASDEGSRWLPFSPLTDHSYERGLLLEVDNYKYIDENTFRLTSKTVNTYTLSAFYDTVKGLKVSYGVTLLGFLPQSDPDLREDYFVRLNYYDFSKFKYLSSSTQTTYDPSTEAINSTQTTDYYYDNLDKHMQLSRMVTTGSDGKKIEKEYTYPLDYTHSGVLGTMQDQFIIGVPVDTKVWEVDGTTYSLIGYSKTDFQAIPETGYSRIYPQYFYSGKMDTPILKSAFDANPSSYYYKTSTTSYDNQGNLVESAKEGQEKNTIIYERNGSKAIAVVANATKNEAAYTGFEANDFGNWTFNGGHEQRISTGGSNSSFSSLDPQTISYNYTIERTGSDPALIVFTEVNGAVLPVSKTLPGTSGTGSVTLAAGDWKVSLEYSSNITSIGVIYDYEYTYYFNPAYDLDHKTGNHSLVLGATNTISKTGLPAGNYVLTYWQKTGAPSVILTGTGSITSTTTNPTGADGWTLVEKQVTIGSTSDQLSITGTCLLEDLKLFPVDAVMSTKSYDARGNLIDETGPNLITTFYEYDDLGRLKIVRDKDNNIIKHYQYTFAN